MRLKLLTRLKIGPSHHNELRFNYDFQSCINPLRSSSLEIVSATHFLLHCHHFSNIRCTVLNSINEVLGSITDLSDCTLVKILLFGGYQSYTQVQNICWSWRRLQYVFSVTILRLPSLEDVLKTCLEGLLKTCLEDVLKTCLEDAFKTLWRQAKYLLGISVSNKSKCVSNKFIFQKISMWQF